MKDFNHEELLIDAYDYGLPADRIARYPLPERDRSKLLVYRSGSICEAVFREAADFLPADALLVYNNTRVIQARMVFRKPTGARIEIFCLEPLVPSDHVLSFSATHICVWKCFVGNVKKWKTGTLSRTVRLSEQTVTLVAERLASAGNTHHIRFSWEGNGISFAEVLDAVGELPIPPYLNRPTEAVDRVAYQTIYAAVKGSVAAPTAGLHFTEAVFARLRERNIRSTEVTLHVGAGTFQPVKTADVYAHEMHTEVISVSRETLVTLCRKVGPIIAVGTTSVRTLESLYFIGVHILQHHPEGGADFHVGQWEPYGEVPAIPTAEALEAIVAYLDRQGVQVLHAQTQIIIKPGYRFRVIAGMFTNFHQPKSTLLLLVAAFAGEDWKRIYDYALAHDFRFLSYGDSSLLLKE